MFPHIQNIYIAVFGDLKQVFVSMKLIQKGNLRVQGSLENIVLSIDRESRSRTFSQYRVFNPQCRASSILKNYVFLSFFRRKSRTLRTKTHIFGSLRAPDSLPSFFRNSSSKKCLKNVCQKIPLKKDCPAINH